MAHFAQLGENNIVKQVIVVSNDELIVDGIESESKGIDFCKSLFGVDTNWVQTSYNGTFRKNYAGIGHTYDIVKDFFYEPQPYPSWTLDDNAKWQAPVEKPNEASVYIWNESTLSWYEVNNGGN